MKDLIVCYDVVSVNFYGSCVALCNEAVVLSKPDCPGDHWIFKDNKTGIVHYVSEPCTVSLVKEIA